MEERKNTRIIEYPILEEEIPNAAEPVAVYTHHRMKQHAPLAKKHSVPVDEKRQADVDAYYEAHREEIEAAYDRIKRPDASIPPAGYYSLAEFDELFKRKITEAYAKV